MLSQHRVVTNLFKIVHYAHLLYIYIYIYIYILPAGYWYHSQCFLLQLKVGISFSLHNHNLLNPFCSSFVGLLKGRVNFMFFIVLILVRSNERKHI